jgi:hypothetical protein
MLAKDKLKYCSSKECSNSNPQPITSFWKNGHEKDKLQNYCITCFKLKLAIARHKNPQKQKDRCNRRRRRNKEKAIKLLGGKCKICGYNKFNGALEFHHTDRTKKDPSLYSIVDLKWDKLVRELQKVILVCANCHREIHNGYTKN